MLLGRLQGAPQLWKVLVLSFWLRLARLLETLREEGRIVGARLAWSGSLATFLAYLIDVVAVVDLVLVLERSPRLHLGLVLAARSHGLLGSDASHCRIPSLLERCQAVFKDLRKSFYCSHALVVVAPGPRPNDGADVLNEGTVQLYKIGLPVRHAGPLRVRSPVIFDVNPILVQPTALSSAAVDQAALHFLYFYLVNVVFDLLLDLLLQIQILVQRIHRGLRWLFEN